MVLNYIGSKKSLLPFIHHVYEEIFNEYDGIRFGDVFSGSGVVSQSFALKGCKVISNDIEKYSFIITKSLTCCCYSSSLQKYIDELNESNDRIKGLFYNNFSEGGGKMFFTPENAERFDFMRSKIEEDRKTLSDQDYVFLLASLISSMDKIANTTSVYGAFLKNYKKSAQQKLFIQPIHQNIKIPHECLVFSMDVNKLVNILSFDCIYLDPPYNQRQYSANYSPLNFAVEYHPDLKVRGKTSILEGNYISPYSQKKKAKEAMEDLIENIQAKHILLSYNDEGIIPIEELQEILISRGSVCLYAKQYKRYKSQQNNGQRNVEEWLFHINTSSPLNERTFCKKCIQE